jgi:hypothetical protein
VNQDQMAGKWKQMRGAIKKEWDRLTDDDLDKASGTYCRPKDLDPAMKSGGRWCQSVGSLIKHSCIVEQ